MRTHEDFLNDLRGSQQTVLFMAEMLRKKGYPVTITPNKEAPTYADNKEHADNGDLLLGMTVEIKQSRHMFTGMDDFPFQNIIIIAKHAWDSRDPKPHSVVMVNKDKTCAAVTKRETEDHWFAKEMPDARYPNDPPQTYYMMPKKHCAFWNLDDKMTR